MLEPRKSRARTRERALIAAAFGLVVAAGSLGLGTGEAHAAVSKPTMCKPYDLTCKYSDSVR
jgi:hypothetical protein